VAVKVIDQSLVLGASGVSKLVVQI